MRASGASVRTPSPWTMRTARSSAGVRARSLVRSASVTAPGFIFGVRSMSLDTLRAGQGRSTFRAACPPSPIHRPKTPGGPGLSGGVLVGLGVHPTVGARLALDTEPVQGIGDPLRLVCVGEMPLRGLDGHRLAHVANALVEQNAELRRRRARPPGHGQRRVQVRPEHDSTRGVDQHLAAELLRLPLIDEALAPGAVLIETAAGVS